MLIFDKISSLDKENLEDIKNNFYSDGLLYFNYCALNNEEITELLSYVCDLNYMDSSNMRMTDFCHDGQKRLTSQADEHEKKMYIQSNWHVDISNLEYPETVIPYAIAMKMKIFKCGKNNGKTIYIDSSQMLDKTPNYIVEWMKRSHVVALSGQDIDTHEIPGLDREGNLWPPRIFPCILSNNKTKKNSFMFTGYCFSVLSSDRSIESDYKDFVYEYLSNESNWITLEWSEGSFVVWDNTRYIHTYSGGWIDGERVFDRFQSGFMIPFYNHCL